MNADYLPLACGFPGAFFFVLGAVGITRLAGILCGTLNALMIATLPRFRSCLLHGTIAMVCAVVGLLPWQHPELALGGPLASAYGDLFLTAKSFLCATAFPLLLMGHSACLLITRSNQYYNWRHGTSR